MAITDIGTIVPIITAFITGILGPVIIKLITKKMEKRVDPLDEAITFADKVHDKLEVIKEDYVADRVYILQFHNGGHYYPTGKSIQKFSMHYEVVNDAKYSTQQSFQNIPVNLFTKSLKHLSDESVISIKDYSDETVATYGLKYIAQEAGVKSSYLFAVKNIDDRFIGVMGVDFASKTSLTDEQVIELEVAATMIGGELSKYLKK